MRLNGRLCEYMIILLRISYICWMCWMYGWKFIDRKQRREGMGFSYLVVESWQQEKEKRRRHEWFLAGTKKKKKKTGCWPLGVSWTEKRNANTIPLCVNLGEEELKALNLCTISIFTWLIFVFGIVCENGIWNVGRKRRGVIVNLSV